MNGPYIVLYQARGILVDCVLALTEPGARAYADAWRMKHEACTAEIFSLPELLAVYRIHQQQATDELERLFRL